MSFKGVRPRAKSIEVEWSFEIMKEDLSQVLAKAIKIQQIKVQLEQLKK